MTLPRVFSIDPGKLGGISVLTTVSDPVAMSLPYIDSRVNSTTLYSLLLVHRPTHIVIEKQMMYRGQSIKAGTTALSNYGRLLGVAEVYAPAEIVLVTPRTWQKVIIPDAAKKETKAASIAHCQETYPNVSLLRTSRSKVPSDGLSDALCIGEWFLRTQYRTQDS